MSHITGVDATPAIYPFGKPALCRLWSNALRVFDHVSYAQNCRRYITHLVPMGAGKYPVAPCVTHLPIPETKGMDLM